MTTDQAAVLAAITADPGDDTARLAYADLLDELGGRANRDRAEFIRAQVEFTCLGEDGTACERTGVRLTHPGSAGPPFVRWCRCRPCVLGRRAHPFRYVTFVHH